MSLETATCPGCDHTFSLRGYQNHLALTWDPLCRAVFDKLKKANDAYELLKSAELEQNSSLGVGSDTEAVLLFQGDAFGTAEDYASDTFGQAMEDNPPPLMEVSDNEDDDDEDVKDDKDDEGDLELANMVVELEKSWEPPWEGAPRQEAAMDDDNVPGLMDISDDEDGDDQEGVPHHEVDHSDVDNNEGHAQHKRKVNCFIIRGGYGVKPAVRVQYNDKYTSACAGQLLTHIRKNTPSLDLT